MSKTKSNISNLQSIKSQMRGCEQATNKYLPSSLKQMKEYRSRNHALQFTDGYLRGVTNSKREYCHEHHISHNTLNLALKKLQINPVCKKTNNSKPSQPTSDNRRHKGGGDSLQENLLDNIRLNGVSIAEYNNNLSLVDVAPVIVTMVEPNKN